MAGPNDNNFRHVPKPYSLHAQILGVKGGEDFATVKKTYRELAQIYHPDKNNGSKKADAKFTALNEAYGSFVTYFKTHQAARAPLTYAQAAGLLGVKGGETLKQVDELYADAVLANKDKGPLHDIHEANHIMLYQIFRAEDHRAKAPKGPAQEPPRKPPEPNPVNERAERLTTTQMAARPTGQPSTDVRPPRPMAGGGRIPPESKQKRATKPKQVQGGQPSTVTAPASDGIWKFVKAASTICAVGGIYLYYAWFGGGYNRGAPLHRLQAGKDEAQHVARVEKDRLVTTRLASNRVLNHLVFAEAKSLTLEQLKLHAGTYDTSPYKGIEENRLYAASADNKKAIFYQGHMPYYGLGSIEGLRVKVDSGSADRALGGTYEANGSEVYYSVIASMMTDEVIANLAKQGIKADMTAKVYSVRGAVINITPHDGASGNKGVRWSPNPETQEKNQMDYNAKHYSIDASVYQRIETPQGSFVVSPDGNVTVLKAHAADQKQSKPSKTSQDGGYSKLKGTTAGLHGLDAERPASSKGNPWNSLSGTISQFKP